MRDSCRRLADDTVESIHFVPASLEALASELMLAEEDIFKWQESLRDDPVDFRSPREFGEIFAVGFSLGEPQHLILIELDQFVAVQIDDRQVVVSRFKLPAGLIEHPSLGDNDSHGGPT